MSAEMLLKRFRAAESRKQNWETLYEDALAYAAPQRETFNDYHTGQEKTGRGLVFDSTAKDAMQKFASNLQSSLTPPYKRWLKLKAGHGFPRDERNELDGQLEIVTDLFFDLLGASNFDTQVAESFLDLAVGTGAMLILQGDEQRPFNFISVPLSQLYLEEGPNGRVDTAFRKWSTSLRNILSTWEDAKLPEQLKESYDKNPEKECELIEGTFPAKVEVYNRRTETFEEVDGFRYQVLDKKTKTIIVDRQMRSNPWVVFRWSTLPGEVYGRGPLLNALPDIKSLNETMKLTLMNAQMSMGGVYTYLDDGVLNPENIEIKPWTFIPVESNGGPMGASVMPLQHNGRFDVSNIVMQDMRRTIKDMLFADPLGPVDLPVKSATEVALRQQELAKRIGSAFGKLQFELITPLVNRCLSIMEDLEIIDLSDFRVDGTFINIAHESPLAQAQHTDDFMALMRYGETLGQVFGPQIAMFLMQPDKFSAKIAEHLGVSEEVKPRDQDMQVLRQLVGQMVMQMMQPPQPANNNPQQQEAA